MESTTCFRKKAREQALRVADAGPPPGEDLSFPVKRQIRASYVIEEMKKDPGVRKLEAAIVLNRPLQGFINECFKCDKRLQRVIDLTSEMPIADPAVFAEAEATVIDDAVFGNLAILRGEHASVAINMMLALLRSFTDEGWEVDHDNTNKSD